ncbi:hypothetical protein ACFOEM_01555 [Paenalcaligenes hominis]|uniref:hypothetical protein n=1 Tax=Paenalcaligenes hominis TaxID=643674 RepID=UPI003612FE5C
MNLDQEKSMDTLPKAVFAVAVLFSAFQVYTAAFSPLSSQVIRAIHVGFVILMIFTLYPTFFGRRIPWLGWLLGGIGFVFSFYHWVFESDLTARAGEMTSTDMVIGIVLILLVFDATRRMMGWALPIICALFLAYGLFGEYLPGALMHRGMASIKLSVP